MRNVAIRGSLERLEPRDLMAAAVWDGGGTDNRWMTAANWVGNVVPKPGDELWFVGGGARKASSNNFPAGTTFSSINFAGGGFTLYGAKIQLTGNVVALNSSGNNNLNTPLVTAAASRIESTFAGTTLSLGGNVALGGTLTIAGSGNTNLTGKISGPAGIVKQGPGVLTQEGDNTYTGTTTVEAGVLAVSGFGNPLGSETTGTVVRSGATLRTLHINDNMGEPLTLFGHGVLAETLGTTSGALEIGPPAITTWTGPITLGDDASIGVNHTGNLTVTGTGIRLNGNVLTINGAGPTTLNSPIVDGSTPGGGLTINSAFVKGTEYGTVTSTVANTYTGATRIHSGVLRLSGEGRLASSDITVRSAPGLGTSNGFPLPVGVLRLDNTATAHSDRIPNTATVILAGGAVDFLGFNGASASTEVLGQLKLTAGHSFVRSEAATNTSASNRLTFASLARSDGATIDFRGTELGAAKNQVRFTTAPSKIGTNGGILPYATYTGTQHDFATYSTAAGIAPFTGYVTDMSTAAANDIVLINASQTLSASMQVAGLLIRDAGVNTTLTLSSGVTLTISNALATASTATNSVTIASGGTGAKLAFGNEGIIQRNTATTIKTAIVGDTALTLSGVGSLTLEPPTEGNSHTSNTTLNSGLLTINNKNSPLGDANATLRLRGGVLGASVFVGAYSIPNPLALDDANANFAAISTLSFTGTISLTGRNIVAVPQNVTLDFVGRVSGSGSLIVTAAMNSGSGGGTLSLSNSNNDYTGGTTLANSGIFVPTLKLNSNTALGTGPLFLSGGNVSAGSVFSIPTRITMAGSNVTFGGTNALRFNGAIDMIGINTLSRNFFDGPMVTLAGIIRGTGALTKNGNHVLRLLGNNTYTGSTLATEGTLGIYGNQPSSAVGVVKNSTAASRLTGDGTLGFLSASKRGIVAPAAGNAFTQLTASGANFSDLGILRLRMGNDIATGADFDSLSVGTGRLIVGPQSILQFDLASATAPRTALGLVHYGARLGVTNQFPAPTLLNNPNGYVASVTYTATDLNLTLASPTTLSAIQADDFFRELGEDNESV